LRELILWENIASYENWQMQNNWTLPKDGGGGGKDGGGWEEGRGVGLTAVRIIIKISGSFEINTVCSRYLERA
jgi:hypothetical protein